MHDKDIILKVENISKQYRLGTIGTGTLSHDLNRWWHAVRGKENPYLKVGEANDRSSKGNSDYVWALQDINFEVQRGEVLGIIGKNGAGKSTLLKILSKVTAPTTGVIKSRGRIASLLEVGTGFNPELTGRENIYLNGAILGMTKKEIASKLDDIIEFSGCERYIDTPTKRYSSGMTVRLAFAVAAFLEPEILVVDEVLAVGDAEFQKKAIGKMQDISRSEGRTVLFVSHNMAAVKSLCTKGIVLEHGKVIFNGDSEEAVNFYLTNESRKIKEDLLEREDRRGSGELRFSSVELLNYEGQNVKELLSGHYAKFRFYFETIKEISAENLVFGVVFRDTNETKIADFYSDEMGVQFHNVIHNGFVDLEIPRLMLRGGEYTLDIVVQNGKIAVNQIDLLHNVFVFNVFAGNLWNSSKINRATNVALIEGMFTE
ncbi:polysaccharide/polyol phosphate ABC transporter ATPase [Flavobacterium saliperosum S13]|uniref:Lipopolysaccharide transport system ATP-binding protein n=2 Tax=Flavobacterium saliperosum TaxID=329186 RepID=A0A1G4VPD0_9FLAO|nr:ABC transporter ATP-binding protein [Flavobacterium saliperosum]ESU23929.1 polysaccharide/polyol phosphate ABC transporter ATPase [Flavobacterium saliperosum S13]SCX09835.1 lipopolysaccharide transport system ATP-binding protein [Flavobacterium saliperosum]